MLFSTRMDHYCLIWIRGISTSQARARPIVIDIYSLPFIYMYSKIPGTCSEVLLDAAILMLGQDYVSVERWAWRRSMERGNVIVWLSDCLHYGIGIMYDPRSRVVKNAHAHACTHMIYHIYIIYYLISRSSCFDTWQLEQEHMSIQAVYSK